MDIPTLTGAIREKLERRLALIEKAPERDFFPEVVPYLEELVFNPFLRPLIEKLNVLKQEDTRKLEGLRAAVEKEVRDNAVVIIGRIRSQTPTYPEVERAIEEYEGLATGQVKSSAELCDALCRELSDICYAVAKHHGVKLIENFAVKDAKGQVLNWRLTPSWDQYHDERKDVEVKERIKPWASWERLIAIPMALGEYRVHWDELKKDFLKLMSISMMVGEMEKLVDPHDRNRTRSTRQSSIFRREETMADLHRLHAFVLDNLDRVTLGTVLLEKYKRRSEWFDRAELLRLCQVAPNKRGTVETDLKRTLLKFLFDQGIFPVAESAFGNQRPDILGIHPSELMPIEAKVFKSTADKAHIRLGFHQIFHYSHSLGESLGYLVIFNASTQTLDIPESVPVEGRTISIKVVNLHGAPSRRPMRSLTIPEGFLTGGLKQKSVRKRKKAAGSTDRKKTVAPIEAILT